MAVVQNQNEEVKEEQKTDSTISEEEKVEIDDTISGINAEDIENSSASLPPVPDTIRNQNLFVESDELKDISPPPDSPGYNAKILILAKELDVPESPATGMKILTIPEPISVVPP